MRVEIYWNLHRNLYSVRALEGRNKGKVIGHASKVLVREVEFVVREAGRQKVLREGRKNVHAFVRGTLEGASWDWCPEAWRMPLWNPGDVAYAKAALRLGTTVTYNPYKFSSFVNWRPDASSLNPIKWAPMAYLYAATEGGKRKGRIEAFDPCEMTEAESMAATY